MPLKLDLKLKSKIRSQIANSKKKFEIFWIFLEFGLNFFEFTFEFAWILALWVEFFEFILEFTQIRALKAEFLPKFTQNSGVKE